MYIYILVLFSIVSSEYNLLGYTTILSKKKKNIYIYIFLYH